MANAGATGGGEEEVFLGQGLGWSRARLAAAIKQFVQENQQESEPVVSRPASQSTTKPRVMSTQVLTSYFFLVRLYV